MDRIQQNQIIAIEKGVKNRVNRELTDLHKAIQKPALLNGQFKTFEKTKEDYPDQPDEKINVQVNAQEVLKKVSKILIEHFDVTATKDWGNCEAKADVVVDGDIIVEQAPVTYLLFLEKELNDIHTFVSKIPTLDPAYEWNEDVNSKLFKSEPVKTQRTAKIQKAIVLYAATEQHPAQTQLITEDENVGFWKTVQISSALPLPTKESIIEKIEALQNAVKSAREKGNSTEVDKKKIGEKVLSYIFK